MSRNMVAAVLEGAMPPKGEWTTTRSVVVLACQIVAEGRDWRLDSGCKVKLRMYWYVVFDAYQLILPQSCVAVVAGSRQSQCSICIRAVVRPCPSRLCIQSSRTSVARVDVCEVVKQWEKSVMCWPSSKASRPQSQKATRWLACLGTPLLRCPLNLHPPSNSR